MGSILVLTLSFLAILYPVAASFPKCLFCVPKSQLLSPAFGIELTPNYAVSAIRFYNGSIAQLLRVEMDGFGLMLDNLSHNASSGPDTQSQENLYKNALFEDVVNLAQATFSTLIRQISLEYGVHLNAALVTLLPTTNRYIAYDVVSRAADLAGLELLLDSLGEMRPDPVAAAAAAHGIGLCSSYRRPDLCAGEELALPRSLVLGVEYTTVSLTLSLSPFQASRLGFSFNFYRHWHLGFSQAMNGNRSYWQQVSQAIKNMRPTGAQTITDVILTGESALQETFLEVLQDSLWEILPDRFMYEGSGQLVNSFINPEYAASFGAAEIAKRVTEAPDDCVERSYCDWWRRWGDRGGCQVAINGGILTAAY